MSIIAPHAMEPLFSRGVLCGFVCLAVCALNQSYFIKVIFEIKNHSLKSFSGETAGDLFRKSGYRCLFPVHILSSWILKCFPFWKCFILPWFNFVLIKLWRVSVFCVSLGLGAPMADMTLPCLLWLLCQAEQDSRSASIISFTVQLGDVLSSDGHFPCLTQTMKWVADSIQDSFVTVGSKQHFL